MIKKIKKREKLGLFELVSKEVGITGIFVFVFVGLGRLGGFGSLWLAKLRAVAENLATRFLGKGEDFFFCLFLGILSSFDSFDVIETKLVNFGNLLSFGVRDDGGNDDLLGFVLRIPVKVGNKDSAVTLDSGDAIGIDGGANTTGEILGLGCNIVVEGYIDLALLTSGSALNTSDCEAKPESIGTDESVERKRDFFDRHIGNSKKGGKCITAIHI